MPISTICRDILERGQLLAKQFDCAVEFGGQLAFAGDVGLFVLQLIERKRRDRRDAGQDGLKVGRVVANP